MEDLSPSEALDVAPKVRSYMLAQPDIDHDNASGSSATLAASIWTDALGGLELDPCVSGRWAELADTVFRTRQRPSKV